MSEGRSPNRIPFESLSDIKPWVVPPVDGQLIKQEKKPKGKAHSSDNEKIEELDASVSMQPLTAEGLQEISETVQTEAQENGYQEGLAKGLAEGEQKGFKAGEAKAYGQKIDELNKQITNLKEISEQLLSPLELQTACLENIVVDMALGFSKHLMGDQIDQDPLVLFSLVKRVVDSLPVGTQHINISLNPDDLKSIESCNASGSYPWQFIADDSVSRGGVVVKTDESLVDYRVETRIKQFIEQAKLADTAAVESLGEPDDYHEQWQENNNHRQASPNDNSEGDDGLSALDQSREREPAQGHDSKESASVETGSTEGSGFSENGSSESGSSESVIAEEDSTDRDSAESASIDRSSIKSPLVDDLTSMDVEPDKRAKKTPQTSDNDDPNGEQNEQR